MLEADLVPTDGRSGACAPGTAAPQAEYSKLHTMIITYHDNHIAAWLYRTPYVSQPHQGATMCDHAAHLCWPCVRLLEATSLHFRIQLLVLRVDAGAGGVEEPVGNGPRTRRAYSAGRSMAYLEHTSGKQDAGGQASKPALLHVATYNCQRSQWQPLLTTTAESPSQGVLLWRLDKAANRLRARAKCPLNSF